MNVLVLVNVARTRTRWFFVPGTFTFTFTSTFTWAFAMLSRLPVLITKPRSIARGPFGCKSPIHQLDSLHDQPTNSFHADLHRGAENAAILRP